MIRKLIYIILLFINAIAASSLLMATFAGLINPTQIVLPALLGLAYEWLIGINIVMCVMWLFTSRKRYILISAISMLISFAPIIRTYNFSNHNHTEITEQHKINIITYNTLRMGKRHLANDNDVIKYITNSNADIVFLQEYEESISKQFLSEQDIHDALKKYPFHYTQFRINNKSRRFGVAIYSKYKLFNFKNIDFESTYNGAFSCDALVDNTVLHLVCAHLESNQLTGTELDQPMEDAKNNNRTQLSNSTKNIIDKLRKAYKLRSIQAKLIAQEISNQSHRTILCGDFNDVPISYTYHVMSHNLVDAFAEAGPRGFGHTFKRKWLHVRIDYILHSNNMKAYNLHIDNNPGSDHYPMRCTLAWD